MKKIVLFLGILFTLFSCNTQRKVVDVSYGASMYGYTMIATQIQVDSMCTADHLPMLDDWKLTEYRDYETSQRICKHLYVKTTDSVYVVTGCEEPYKITKRISK